MRRIATILVTTVLCITPLFSACVPSGYESVNPNRPPDQQVDIQAPEEGQTTDETGTPTETPSEAPTEEETGE
jgi:hypothetical protein